MSEHDVPPSFRRSRNISVRLMIIGDGVTEKRYFDWFRSRTSGMRVIPKALGESGGEHIVNICSRICRNERLDLSNGDRLAIVTDLDYNYSRSDLDNLIELCRRRGFELYISNPSFEVWLLMHYRDVTRPYSQQELIEAMDEALGHKYVKSAGIDMDPGKVSMAIERSRRRLDDASGPTACFRIDTSTNVHELVATMHG